MQKIIRVLLVSMVVMFTVSNSFAKDIEEGDAKAEVKKAKKALSKFKKVDATAQKQSLKAEQYLDKARKYINDEEWEVAYYFAQKSKAYVQLGYAVKKNKEMQKRLKNLK